MLTVKIFIVLNILIFSGDIFGQQLVVEISNCKIYDHQLKKSDKLAPQLFYKKFGFLPSSNTTEELESLKHNLRLYKLKTIITNKILQNLEKKYFNKVVTQEDINDFLLKNQIPKVGWTILEPIAPYNPLHNPIPIRQDCK